MNSYYVILVKGRDINRFLHKCSNNINIINIKYISPKEIIIKININDYNKLLKIKSIYKIEIINTIGLIKFKELINKNRIILISFSIGIIFLIILSNMIFNIKIISNNTNLNNVVKKELETYGIKKYNFKKSYNQIQKIKEDILNRHKDNIEWIEITDIGTLYEIKIVERKKKIVDPNNEYSNIVAKKSGVIKKIYAENGQKMVDINTYVNKGDIIISGTITKAEEEKEYVTSKGKVYAEVWYDVNIEFPLKYTEKLYTNKTKKSPYIKIFNKYIELKRFKNFERKTIINLDNKLAFFEIGIEKEKEVKIINDTYNIDEAKLKAVLLAKEKVLQTLDKDEYVIDEKVLKFTKKDSKIILDMFFTCFEEIGKEETFIPIKDENE